MTASHLPHKRRFWWLVGSCSVAALLILFAALSGSFTSVCWTGRQELQVHVLVCDAGSDTPLSKVPITLFDGPVSPPDAPPYAVWRKDDGIQRATTDENGRATFSRTFFAAGRDNSGYIKLSGTWAQIAAPDFCTVLVPIYGQERPRRLDDKSPVFVTVFLKRSDAALDSSASRANGGSDRSAKTWLDTPDMAPNK